MRSKSIAIALFLAAPCAAQNYSSGPAIATVTISGAPMYYVPANAVMVFTSTVCPNGWTEFTAGRGRYIVGRPVTASSTGTVVGTALTQAENRATGLHTHGIIDGTHMHQFPILKKAISGAPGEVSVQGVNDTADGSLNTDLSSTGVTVDDAGTVVGTNAPFIQMLTCVKN